MRKSNKRPTSFQAESKRESKKIRPKGRLSRELSAYFSSYVRGGHVEDPHVPVFRALKAEINPTIVLYPGCHRHITLSLFFQSVHYVDVDAKVGGLYTDSKALAFIAGNKEYPEPSDVRFSCKNYKSRLVKLSSVDLLVSLSAGIVSQSCGKYLKPGGYFLVNDSHSDARTTFLDSRFRLAGVYNEATQAFDNDEKVLEDHFHTREGKEITQAIVNESIEKPQSRRSFKLKAESMFYLFQKSQKRSLPSDDENDQIDLAKKLRSM